MYSESDKAGVLEVTADEFIRIKELMYESGLKKDFLMLESTLRRNFFNKKNLRQ